MTKTLFFDVGYTLVNEDAVWERRCKEQAETEEAKKLGAAIKDVYSAQTLYVQQGLDMNSAM